MRRGYLLYNRSVLTAEIMTHARLNSHYVACCQSLERSVQFDIDVAKKDMEGFFLLSMVLSGVLLAREENDQLFAVHTIHNGHHGETKFVESVDPIVMGDFQVHLRRDRYAAPAQKRFYLLHYVKNFFLEISDDHIGGEQRGIGLDVLAGVQSRIF